MNTIPPADCERPSQDDTIEAWRRRIGRLDPRQIAAGRTMTPAQRLDLARHPADAGGSQPGEGNDGICPLDKTTIDNRTERLIDRIGAPPPSKVAAFA